MLLYLLILLLLSNAVSSRQDQSIIFSRLAIVGLISTIFFTYHTFFIIPIEQGIHICGEFYYHLLFLNSLNTVSCSFIVGYILFNNKNTDSFFQLRFFTVIGIPLLIHTCLFILSIGGFIAVSSFLSKPIMFCSFIVLTGLILLDYVFSFAPIGKNSIFFKSVCIIILKIWLGVVDISSISNLFQVDNLVLCLSDLEMNEINVFLDNSALYLSSERYKMMEQFKVYRNWNGRIKTAAIRGQVMSSLSLTKLTQANDGVIHHYVNIDRTIRERSKILALLQNDTRFAATANSTFLSTPRVDRSLNIVKAELKLD